MARAPSVLSYDDIRPDDGIQVLIVDANVYNSIALLGIFLRYQHEANQTFSGYEALKMVKNRLEDHGTTYRLILIDYTLPGMSAIETV